MNVLHLGRYLRSPQVPRWRKWLGVLAIAYAVLPFDAIPDAVPLVGWLDDAGVLAAAFTLLARDLRRFSAEGAGWRAPAPGARLERP